ncbi:terminase small subunit [Lactobacillus reuteri]|uniref:terminase small subunit n=1 Tax=Limosilactobacillus reuteri TaxID=1598 RepID=UPI00146A0B7E|nr:terminase small subunit [Limosilactobacillus reuteri]NMV48476.1 terminase small subunit [Limosilactobacillus reuteri]NMV50224.1 terminase small subunit [Limosilactobacillus reuteri]NMV59699.1 terminase small subunit [Limosilactobacillus reuteri]NMV63259.1 terminase small subunit [Limosilactobacillus reuteri]NMV66868.1 terminase small subunit [Limosilactobacillus reuteri]
MKLTVKQRMFADEYIKSGNATQSAIKAGYNVRNARVIGAQNLSKLNIKSYIDAKMAEIESHKIADAKEVLEFYTRVLRKEETEPEKLMDEDGSEHFYDHEPSLKDRLSAAKELMKRYPLNDPVVQAQLERIKATTRNLDLRNKNLEDGGQDVADAVNGLLGLLKKGVDQNDEDKRE